MTISSAFSLRAISRRLLRDNRGVTAVTVAVSLSALLGVAGLGVDTGMWYTMKRQNQSAADAAALSGAYEVMAGSTSAIITAAVNEAATQNGWVNTGTAPAINVSYSDTLVPSGVEVKLYQTQNSWFASFASLANVTIATRAVALVKTLDSSCMLALDPFAAKAVSIIGSATVSMPDCSVAAKSTASNAIYMQGGAGASLTADTLITPGGFSTTGSTTPTLTKPAEIGAAAPAIIDPYAATLTHTALTAGMPPCTTSNPPAAPVTADSRFCGGLNIKGITVDLQPPPSGHLTIWITDGDLQLGPGGGSSILECTTCNVASGKGVTIILTTGLPSGGTVGTVNVASSSAQILSMNAPSSGPFKGVLIVQDSWGLPAGTTFTSTSSKFQGGPGVTFSGLVYFPKSNMSFQGNPTVGSTACLVVVADTISVVGNSSLATSGCTSDGLGSTPTIKTVVLAE